MTATVAPLTAPSEEFVPVRTTDPERWTTNPDDEAKALCAHARRAGCARGRHGKRPAPKGCGEGVVIPEAGRGRDFAMRQLRSLAAHGGYPVRPGYRARRRVVLPSA
jgi:WhiB family transcriptional regulator, redox-sensing transcriptional regulator